MFQDLAEIKLLFIKHFIVLFAINLFYIFARYLIFIYSPVRGDPERDFGGGLNCLFHVKSFLALLFAKGNHHPCLQTTIEGVVIAGMVGKKFKAKHPWDHNKWGGLVKCPRNTAPYILSNTLKWFLSSSPKTTIIGMTFSYVISAFDSNISLCPHLATQ